MAYCLLFSCLFYSVQGKSFFYKAQVSSNVLLIAPDTQHQEGEPILEAQNFQLAYKREQGTSWKPFGSSAKLRYIDTLRVSFDLKGNVKVPRSSRRLYLVVQDPNGNTIEEIGQFTVQGESIPYTSYMDVEYTPGRVNRFVFEFWTEDHRQLFKGRYIFRIYDQEIEIGLKRVIFY